MYHRYLQIPNAQWSISSRTAHSFDILSLALVQYGRGISPLNLRFKFSTIFSYIFKCYRMVLFVIAVNYDLCTTFRTVLVKMTFVNEQTVNAQFLKINHGVFPLGVVELVELRLD